MKITSLQNPQVKFLRALHKRRIRSETGLFTVEGVRENRLLAFSQLEIVSVWYCPDLIQTSEIGLEILEELSNRSGSKPVAVSSKVFDHLVYRGKSEGILTVAKQNKLQLEELDIEGTPLYVVAIGLEKPGNLGSILRSADAVACDGVIVCDQKMDLYNPNVIRASVGTLFSVPTVITTTCELRDWLDRQNIRLFAASPDADQSYTNADFTDRCCLMIGSEHSGIPEDLLQYADEVVQLPVLGKSDSLNAAMTTAVLLFEAQRQRTSVIS